MQRDPRASTTADPAQRGVDADPRRWLARSLASPQALAKIELQTLANAQNGPSGNRQFDAMERRRGSGACLPRQLPP